VANTLLYDKFKTGKIKRTGTGNVRGPIFQADAE